MKKCLFAGTFDPITKGHIDIIKTLSSLFDEVYVAICVNSAKKSLFSLETREACVKEACKEFKNVKVLYHEGFLVDLMKSEGIKYNVRGIRNLSDYEYETEMHEVNTRLYDGLTTIFLPCTDKYRHVSSTLVRELVFCGKDFKEFVPESAYKLLKDELTNK
ncbi:MAG: pantetheine-phosphate adenylyltransferase [Clostridia bacterium]|nr:pantetheine-phosphate adenylyltransferase [Clostridia bacterium]